MPVLSPPPSDQADVVEVLLERGANVNALNSAHCTSLMVAVHKEYTRCVQTLLSHAADPNIQVTALNIQVTALNIQVTALNIQLTALNIQVTALNIQVTALNIQVTALNIQVTALNIQVTALNIQVTALLPLLQLSTDLHSDCLHSSMFSTAF